MKKLLIAFVGLILLVAGGLVGRYVWPSGAPEPDAEEVEVVSKPQLWTCSMHPQIIQPEPGDCPICGMELIPMTSGVGDSQGPRELHMSESARALADIQTAGVERRVPVKTLRLVGTLAYDETRVKSLTARFPARIDALFVNFTGIPVKTGEHLAEVYSPELLTAQRELLSAHARDPDGVITRAAREKLRLWGLLPDQIDSIVSSGEAQDSFVLRAPLGGVVVEKQVREGEYVKTGQPLFRIVDFSGLWLELDAYESDLPWLRYGQEVRFTVAAHPGEAFAGTVVFIEPEIDRETRTAAVRVNVPNPDGRLKPGMFARGGVEAQLGVGGQVTRPDLAGKWISPMHPEIVKDGPGTCDVCGMELVSAESLGLEGGGALEAPLVVPVRAVLRTGTRSVVYVEQPGTDSPVFEGREVELGARADDGWIVLKGLEEGDRVVVNGAFKIDSSLQIQARPSLMSVEEDAMPDDAAIHLNGDMAESMLPSYLELQQALADDNLEAAKRALGAMMKVTGHNGEVAMMVHAMMEAENLDAMRRPHFDHLSAVLIQALEGQILNKPLYRMRCPMVYSDREEAAADWLQADPALRNPYFGAMMLQCGETVAVIGGKED